MILIGLTGGIACGKSTVSAMLEQNHHIEIIDADSIVRGLQSPGAPCTRRIARRWPGCVDPLTGALHRDTLGRVVFNDPKARHELAKIMGPPILWAILTRIAGHWWREWRRASAGPRVVVLDAPTLFETGIFLPFISNSLVVFCSEQTQLERLQARNGFSREEALSRIQCQMPLDRKRRLAGYAIENDGAGLEILSEKVGASVAWMQQQRKHKLTIIFGGTAALAVLAVALACKVIFGYCRKSRPRV